MGTREAPKTIAITPTINYACRGNILQPLCFVEYSCLVEVVAAKENTATKTHERGRPCNAHFLFHPKHVLHAENYVQRLVALCKCPILSGKRVPVYPGSDGTIASR